MAEVHILSRLVSPVPMRSMALQHTSEKALPQQAAVEALQRVSATAASAGSCVLLLAWQSGERRPHPA